MRFAARNAWDAPNPHEEPDQFCLKRKWKAEGPCEITGKFSFGMVISDLGGFQLADLIITKLKSHMTCKIQFLSLVEITAFRLKSKACKGLFLKINLLTGHMIMDYT